MLSLSGSATEAYMQGRVLIGDYTVGISRRKTVSPGNGRVPISATTQILRGSAAAAFGAPARSSSAIAKAFASSLRTRSPVHRRPLYPAASVRLHLALT